jgi:hypothetical protein
MKIKRRLIFQKGGMRDLREEIYEKIRMMMKRSKE